MKMFIYFLLKEIAACAEYKINLPLDAVSAAFSYKFRLSVATDSSEQVRTSDYQTHLDVVNLMMEELPVPETPD